MSGRNPLLSEAVPSDLLFWSGLTALAASMLLGALAMVLRMRQAHGVERQQLKWMVFAVGLVVPTLPFGAPLYASFVGVRIWDAIVMTAVPLAALAAIWRYRLYDIELIISRTVLYACVTAVLGGSFAALVVGLGVVFGRGSTIATALATLVVALAFRPLLRFFQTLRRPLVRPRALRRPERRLPLHDRAARGQTGAGGGLAGDRRRLGSDAQRRGASRSRART